MSVSVQHNGSARLPARFKLLRALRRLRSSSKSCRVCARGVLRSGAMELETAVSIGAVNAEDEDESCVLLVSPSASRPAVS